MERLEPPSAVPEPHCPSTPSYWATQDLIDPEGNATAGAGMIRGFEDDVPATPGGAVIFLGNRAALSQDLEERLLYRGSLLLRTRVSNGNALWPMTFGRSVILSESVAGDEPILIIHQDGRHEHGISADVDEIPCRLDRRANVPTGGCA